jgi:hexosaminidase
MPGQVTSGSIPSRRKGRARGAKLRPFAGELRLHAERAITLIAEARAAAKLENRTLKIPEALDALELGARRIDFVGLKFQAADESVALYNQARAGSRRQEPQGRGPGEAVRNHRREQRALEDIRDGYALLGGLYRQAWLRDNRPYWLENNQARYDRAAQLWIGRSDHWSQVLQQWWNSHTLPTAAEAGLPEPAQHPEQVNKEPKQGNKIWDIFKKQ